HIASSTVHEPSSIEALVGSRITFNGAGDAAGLSATLAGANAAIAGSGGTWTTSVVMPGKAGALRFVDGKDERLVILITRVDSVPVVTLEAPARDTVLRDPHG